MSEDAIKAKYTALIAEAGDDQLAALQHQVAMSNEISEFYRGEVRAKDVLGWKSAALSKFPRARMDEVRGDTVEELEASAKASHDHVETFLAEEREKIKREAEDQVGRASYGSPSQGSSSPRSAAKGTPTKEEKYEALVKSLDERIDRDDKIGDAEYTQLISSHMEPQFEEMMTRHAANPSLQRIVRARQQSATELLKRFEKK